MNENNPVDKVKKVTVTHVNAINQYLIRELQDLITHKQMIDICKKVTDEITQTSLDVGNIYIAHEGMMIEQIKEALIEKLK